MAGSCPAQSFRLMTWLQRDAYTGNTWQCLTSPLLVNTMFWCTFLDLGGGATFKGRIYRDAKFKQLNT